MSIGSRIREARKLCGISQGELAKMIGIDQSSVSDIERDKTTSTSLTASYARALNVNAYWLETGKGSMQLKYASDLDNLSDQEKQLIEQFRHISSEGKEIALRSVSLLANVHPGSLRLASKSNR